MTSSSKANRHSASFASKESPISLRTPLCDLLGIDVPIIGAPFGPWHQVELAAAVCAAGGLGSVDGVAASGGGAPRAVGDAEEATDRPFAINHSGRPFDPDMFEAVLDFRPAVVSFDLAEPAGLIERAHAVGALWMRRVMSVEQTRCAIDLGADVIIAQGGKAGAHGDGIATGLVPQVVDAAGVVPVVAAGGIADGRGLVAALAMGAQGVSMEVPRSPFLEHRAGRADELGRRASELGAEMIEVLPVGEIARRSLAHAEDALARLQTYRAVRCGLAESSSGRHT